MLMPRKFPHISNRTQFCVASWALFLGENLYPFCPRKKKTVLFSRMIALSFRIYLIHFSFTCCDTSKRYSVRNSIDQRKCMEQRR